jgi:hydroxymethylbilane synthase
MSFNPVRIASRRSPLAVAQTDLVRQFLSAVIGIGPDDVADAFPVETFVTTGDRLLNPSLSEIGGKGLFTKEIEIALLDGAADIAVHSMKDMPATNPPGLVIAAVPRREDPHDAFVTLDGRSLDDMPAGARIGTSSTRRAAQLRRARPDLVVVPFRGNVQTRLRKLEAGEADATFLAEAGLRRLGRDDVKRVVMPAGQMLPALGQGTLCVQCRAEDAEAQALCARIDDLDTALANAAERAVIEALGGSCKTPIAGLATAADGHVSLRAEILTPDGTRAVQAVDAGPVEAPTHAQQLDRAAAIGVGVANRLREAAGPDLERMLAG